MKEVKPNVVRHFPVHASLVLLPVARPALIAFYQTSLGTLPRDFFILWTDNETRTYTYALSRPNEREKRHEKESRQLP